jgi:hypothetical protein
LKISYCVRHDRRQLGHEKEQHAARPSKATRTDEEREREKSPSRAAGVVGELL